MTTSEEMRQQIRAELGRGTHVTSISFNYGSRNQIRGHALLHQLDSPRIRFAHEGRRQTLYDRSSRTLYLVRHGQALNYFWSLVVHEILHAYVHQHLGLGIMDDEVCAHLVQLLYYKNRTGSWEMGFSVETRPRARAVFEAARNIIQSHGLRSGTHTISSEDVEELKRALRTYGYSD